MDNALLLTFILFILELIEALLQRAQTLMGILQKLNGYYQKSIFLFFIVHPGFYFVLFVVMATGILNISMIFILALKIFDIFYKLELLQKVFKQQEVSPELGALLGWQIPSWYFLLGSAMYPPLLWYALT